MERMEKQTAVEWLTEKLRIEFGFAFSHLNILEQAKEMEKQQIEDAYKDGRFSGQTNWGYGNDTTSEQYYNETFKSE
jgi:hypothetical protein